MAEPQHTHSQNKPFIRIPRYTLPCAVESCDSLVGKNGSHGYCGKHAQRYRTTGDPLGSTAMTSKEKFQTHVEVDENTGCWNWVGSKNRAGYGRVRRGGKVHRAHRWAYELYRESIPDGLVIDHLCRNHSCVNPWHLEPVTNDENCERGWGRRIKTGWINHCIHGHEFTPENTYINPLGRKICRTCSDKSREKYYRKIGYYPKRRNKRSGDAA